MLDDLLRSWIRGYFQLPGWARTAAGVAYRTVPLRVRLGATYGSFTDLIRKTEQASPEQLQAYQWNAEGFFIARMRRKRL